MDGTHPAGRNGHKLIRRRVCSVEFRPSRTRVILETPSSPKETQATVDVYSVRASREKDDKSVVQSNSNENTTGKIADWSFKFCLGARLFEALFLRTLGGFKE